MFVLTFIGMLLSFEIVSSPVAVTYLSNASGVPRVTMRFRRDMSAVLPIETTGENAD